MTRRQLSVLTVVALCGLVLMLGAVTGLLRVAPASAQSGSGNDLSWWTVDGGGGTSVSWDGRYALGGTLGQPDPGLLTLAHLAIPFAELAPDYIHPNTGESLKDIADRLRLSATLLPRPDVAARLTTR